MHLHTKLGEARPITSRDIEQKPFFTKIAMAAMGEKAGQGDQDSNLTDISTMCISVPNLVIVAQVALKLCSIEYVQGEGTQDTGWTRRCHNTTRHMTGVHVCTWRNSAKLNINFIHNTHSFAFPWKSSCIDWWVAGASTGFPCVPTVTSCNC